MNRLKLNAIAAAIALTTCHAAQATTITFDEFAATNNNVALTNLYAGLGVTFSSGNSGTWNGLTQGDPGNWGLQGTNGSAFLGHNGVNNPQYSMEINFASAVSDVFFDVSRSNGSLHGQAVSAIAYRGNTVIGQFAYLLGETNSWMSVGFSNLAGANKLVLDVDGPEPGVFSPYGIDNLRFNTITQAPAPVPEPETYAMMLAGLGLLGIVARRRRQQTAT